MSPIDSGAANRRRATDGFANLIVAVASLVAATLVAAVLETWLGVVDASAVYLLAVVVVAGRQGTAPGIAVSIVSFLTYDFLFTQPRFTFAVGDPEEWLSLLLFLIIAVVIGRLSAIQAERAHEATLEAREAQAMLTISRALTTAVSMRDAAAEIVADLCHETGLSRAWIGVGPSPGHERRLADTAPDEPLPNLPVPWVLHRSSDGRPAEWMRTHLQRPVAGHEPGAMDVATFRVAIEADSRSLGSLWAIGPRTDGPPGRAATRLLSLASDQVGLAMRREQLATEASSAEVARRSDALKSALIDSVSHDLRTPLATIRATAGGLLDDEVPASAADARRAAETIDREAARLSEVVTNLLDLSRIEGGAIRADVEAHELDDLVRSCVARHRSAFGNRPIDVDVSTALPPVLVDALFFDQALANVLENAVRHAGAAARIRIHADVPRSVEAPAPLIEVREAAARGAASTLDPGDDDHVDLLVEDGGPGVSDTEMPRLFDKFYGRSRAATGGRGVGIGLTVARGLIEAGGGSISAERSSLGGLAIRIRLPFAVGNPSLRPPAPLLVP